MPRRAVIEEDEHLERWLISYADFITLLMAFFVVMYSISAVNEGKYKILSATLSEAFRTPTFSLKPVQQGELVRTEEEPGQPDNLIPLEAVSGAEQAEGQKGPAEELQEIRGQLTELFQDLIQNDLISVTGDELWVEIEMKSSLLFGSGSAELSADAEVILEQLGRILRQHRNPMHVEGFTDDRPIATEAYPTNWELSTARSSAIIRLLTDVGVAPERMAAVGYAEFQPVADNATEEGRQQNRRVVLVISRNLDIRRSVAAVGSDAAAGARDQFLDLANTVRDSEIRRGPGPEQPPQPAPVTPTAAPPAPRGVPEAPVQTPSGPLRTLRLPSGGLLFTRQPEAPAEAAGTADEGEP